MERNQPQLPAWRAQDALNLVGQLHDLPKHPEHILPKFDWGKAGSLEDHIKNFYLAIWLLDVEHEDVVCKLFPYAFENKASTWHFNQ
jgi:hypothetical protein